MLTTLLSDHEVSFIVQIYTTRRQAVKGNPIRTRQKMKKVLENVSHHVYRTTTEVHNLNHWFTNPILCLWTRETIPPLSCWFKGAAYFHQTFLVFFISATINSTVISSYFTMPGCVCRRAIAHRESFALFWNCLLLLLPVLTCSRCVLLQTICFAFVITLYYVVPWWLGLTAPWQDFYRRYFSFI